MALTSTPSVQDRLTLWVLDSGLSQAKWAEILDLSRQSVSDRMRGRTAWTLADAAGIADHLDLSLDALVGLRDDLPLGYALEERAVPA